MADSREQLTGVLNVVHTFTVKVGMMDKLLDIVIKIRDHCKAEEPGNLKFEILRYRDSLVVFESYADEASIARTLTSEPFQAYIREGLSCHEAMHSKWYESV